MATGPEDRIDQWRDQLRAELQAEMRMEMQRLRAALGVRRVETDVVDATTAAAGGSVPDGAGSTPPADASGPVREGSGGRLMSRRGALLFGTAAAVGAGLVAEVAASASPAAAALGDPLTLGATTNDAQANDTAVTSSGPDYTLQVTNTGAGQGLVAGDGAVGSGAGVVATLLNSANTSSALSGVTGGTGAGVSALSAGGYGVDATGLLAPLHLSPGLEAGPPTSGAHALGELYVDANGVFFKAVAAGTPGTWAPLYSVVLLASPIRLLDTRKGATAAATPGAPVSAGSTLPLQVTGQAVGGIEVPTGAIGVVGNVTAVDATARGYLTVFPDGVPTPGTSSLNFPVSTSVANGVTVALSTSGKLDIFASQTTDVVFDAAGYLV